MVSPGYFTTLGVEILVGRSFGDRPFGGGAGTAVVNDAFDRAVGGRSIGRRLRSAAARNTWGADAPGEFEIIGVVEDERFRGLEAPSQPAIYLSTREFPQTSFSLLLRTGGRRHAVAGDIRRLMRDIEPGATVGTPTTLGAILSEQLVARRVTTEVIGGFAGVALALAALGLYGLLAMLVARGRHDIGVRIALGASPGRIARHVLQDALRHTVAGTVLGIGLSLVAGRLLEGLLVGISSRDPLVLGTIVAIVLVVATGASLVPAIRASRIDPAVALRAD